MATLVFAAVGVIVQLKDALNTVWEVEPSGADGVWQFLRSYVVSFAAVLALGFLLLTSMVITALVAAFSQVVSAYVQEWILHLVSTLVSFSVVSLLFAMMFKWLPDAPVDWSDVWLGAVVTAVLFELGKSAIGFYIGKQALSSTFGAAASIVVVLIWVYYSAQIVLMGAEITRAFAVHKGSISRRNDQADGSVM
jgi:membrane protein